MLSIGIVGCGNHAHTHAEAIANDLRFTISACVDMDIERADKFAQTYGIKHVYQSIDELGQGVSVDLLIIVAYPAIHVQLIKQAIHAGFKAILCEKPLGMSLSEVRQIEELAKQHGVLIVEGLMYRAHPQIIEASKLIETGYIGEIKYIHAMFTDYASDHSGNWRNDTSLGGGSMTAKGCYLVDVCNLFSGAAASSAFAIETVDTVKNVEVGITGTILYNNGVIGHIETNHRSSWREEIRVTGTKGTLTIPHAIVTKQQERQVIFELHGLYEFRKAQQRTINYPAVNSYHLQLEAIYQAMRNGKEAHITLDHSLNNYMVTDALLRSTKSGRLEQIV